MKIYIISIARNKHRLDSLTARLLSLNLDFEVVMGVDGRDMSDLEFESYNQDLYIHMYGKPMNRYEISCTLGHMGVWRKMLADKTEKALVLEDDVCILSSASKIIKYIEREEINFDILYLHHGKAKKWPIYKSLPENYRLYRYLRPTSNSRRAITYATAYVIKMESASSLLKEATTNMMPADFIVGLLQRHRLRTWGVEPCCVDHGHFETSTPGRY